MSKKKLLSFTALGIVVFYLISVTVVYSLSKEIQSRNFDEAVQSEYESMLKTINSSTNAVNLTFDLCGFSPRYPTVFVLLDSNGNVILSSKQKILCDYFNENAEYIESFIVELDEYLTDEVKEQIENLKKYMSGSSYFINSLSICKRGDKYIPVEASFDNISKGKDNIIKFSDETPDFTIYNDFNSTINLYGFNESQYKSYRKEYEKLCTNLDDFISDFKYTHENMDYNTESTLQGPIDGLRQYEKCFGKGGVKLCFYFESRCDMRYETLTSDNFTFFFRNFSFAFIVMALAVMIVISEFYNKNQRLVKEREAFIAAAAHELKTPIAVIANKSECILEDVSPELNKEYVNSIYDESKRMSRMVKTLLQYNKLRQDTKIQKQPQLLYDIIYEQASKYRPLFEAKNITYSEDIDIDYVLKCNKDLIGLVIDNYLSNAVKFVPDGGKIKISAKKVMGNAVFEIYNSGSVISKEDAPHIWEELYSGDKARTRTDDSTGMGLAICKLIFELHKFEYGFRNVSDGVVFRFSGK